MNYTTFLAATLITLYAFASNNSQAIPQMQDLPRDKVVEITSCLLELQTFPVGNWGMSIYLPFNQGAEPFKRMITSPAQEHTFLQRYNKLSLLHNRPEAHAIDQVDFKALDDLQKELLNITQLSSLLRAALQYSGKVAWLLISPVLSLHMAATVATTLPSEREEMAQTADSFWCSTRAALWGSGCPLSSKESEDDN